MSYTIVISVVTIDTNILVYSIDRRDQAKHQVASQIVARCLTHGCTIALQALNEFFRAVTGKGLLPDGDAIGIIDDARSAMKVVLLNEADLVHAMTSHRQHNIQFFDALLVATVKRAGCTILLSEDMHHGGDYDGLTVLNPFKLSPDELSLVLS